jgi:hypothetical protein
MVNFKYANVAQLTARDTVSLVNNEIASSVAAPRAMQKMLRNTAIEANWKNRKMDMYIF